MAVGVLAYGAHIPRYRLDRTRLRAASQWLSPGRAPAGRRAVAGPDEDSLTLAVAAGNDLLSAWQGPSAEALLLASTTLPYAERQHSAIAARALDLAPTGPVQDLGGSARAGLTALRVALERSMPGRGATLVLAADCRHGKVGSDDDLLGGDGAAALLVGEGAPLAELLALASASQDFPDRWRSAQERSAHQWEERFVRAEGQIPALTAVAQRCLEAAGLGPESLDLLGVALPAARAVQSLARQLGVPKQKLVGGCLAEPGDTGAALGPLLLVEALERAQPGQTVLILGWGSGAEAILLRCTEHLPHRRPSLGLAGSLRRGRPLDCYEQYAALAGLLSVELGKRGEAIAPTALSVHWRSVDAVLGLQGCRCPACGTPQFPPNRVCVRPDCRSVDTMEPYGFARRRGRIFTYTADHLAFSLTPPALYGLVDFEGGGRLFLDFSECDEAELAVGLPVEMSFRRKYQDAAQGLQGYFWKAVPVPTPLGPGA